jgi:hypothetical protein
MTMNSGGFGQTHSSLMNGAPVFTVDGDKLGEVKEIKGDHFKVNAAMQPDYWLCTDDIGTVDGNRVVMTFDKDHLGDSKFDDPDKHHTERHAA